MKVERTNTGTLMQLTKQEAVNLIGSLVMQLTKTPIMQGGGGGGGGGINHLSPYGVVAVDDPTTGERTIIFYSEGDVL